MSKRLLPLLTLLVLCEMLALAFLHVQPRKSFVIDTPVAFTPPQTYVPAAGDGLVCVNTASVEELDALEGISRKVAQAIVTEREENGAFYFPEDLLSVKGIGEKTLEKIRDKICFE